MIKKDTEDTSTEKTSALFSARVSTKEKYVPNNKLLKGKSAFHIDTDVREKK